MHNGVMSSHSPSTSPRRHEFHIEVASNASALDVVTEHLHQAGTPLSRTQLKQWFSFGAVWLTSANKTRRLRRGKTRIAAGDTVHFYCYPALLDEPVLTPNLIADEGDYSVWFKPAGMMVQGTQWGDGHALLRLAELQLQRPVKLIHRLDRHTSGLILLAHTKTAAAGLSGLFQNRHIIKVYHAVVQGVWGEAITVNESIDDKPAESHVMPLQHVDDYSELEIRITTGRKHQIRKHLSGYGMPIVGDNLYGQTHLAGMQLRAVRLEFDCPLRGIKKCYSLPGSLLTELLGSTQ